MATQRIDQDSASNRASNAATGSSDESKANRIQSASLQPVTSTPQSSVEPSPVSRTQESTAGDEGRDERIARAAYRLAEQRGFAPGGEVEDWLAAEREIDGDSSGR
jgi:hypothetical protein